MLVTDVGDEKFWRQFSNVIDFVIFNIGIICQHCQSPTFCHQHNWRFIKSESLEVSEVRRFPSSIFRFFSSNSLFLYFVLLYFRPIYRFFHEALFRMTIFEICVEKLKLVTGDVNTTVVLTRQQSPQLQQKQCRRQSFRQKCFHHLNHQNLLLFGFLHCRVLMKLSHVGTNSKLGCVFPMVILARFPHGAVQSQRPSLPRTQVYQRKKGPLTLLHIGSVDYMYVLRCLGQYTRKLHRKQLIALFPFEFLERFESQQKNWPEKFHYGRDFDEGLKLNDFQGIIDTGNISLNLWRNSTRRNVIKSSIDPF